MNESQTLADELIKVLDYTIDKFNITVNIKSEEILNYAKQLSTKIVAYELVTSLMISILCTISIICLYIMIKRANKKLSIKKAINSIDSLGRNEKISFYISILCMIILGILSVILICNIIEIVQCIVFPEKIILEFISNYK